MSLYKIVVIGILTVFISTIAILYLVDGISQIRERCKIQKTLKICQTNTLTIVLVVLMIIGGGLVIIILTVSYIMMNATKSTEKTVSVEWT